MRIGSQVLSPEFTPLTPRLSLWEAMAVSLLGSTGPQVFWAPTYSTLHRAARCAQWKPSFACSAIPAHLPCPFPLFSSHSVLLHLTAFALSASSAKMSFLPPPPSHPVTSISCRHHIEGSRDELRKVSSHCFPLCNSWVLEICPPVLVYLFTFFNAIIWWATFLILLNQINQAFLW